MQKSNSKYLISNIIIIFNANLENVVKSNNHWNPVIKTRLELCIKITDFF